jgi:hypothetical protein
MPSANRRRVLCNSVSRFFRNGATWRTIATQKKRSGCMHGGKTFGIEAIAVQTLQLAGQCVDGGNPRGPHRRCLGGRHHLWRRLEHVTEKEQEGLRPVPRIKERPHAGADLRGPELPAQRWFIEDQPTNIRRQESASKAHVPPSEWPTTSTALPTASITAAISSHSRSSAYASASPL